MSTPKRRREFLQRLQVTGILVSGAVALLLPGVAFCQNWSGGYKEVGSEISCSMYGLSMMGTVSHSSYISPNGGSVTRLTCNTPGKKPKDILLKSKEFNQGFLDSKDFGRIQIFFANSLMGGGGWEMGMTDGGKKKLIHYLDNR